MVALELRLNGTFQDGDCRTCGYHQCACPPKPKAPTISDANRIWKDVHSRAKPPTVPEASPPFQVGDRVFCADVPEGCDYLRALDYIVSRLDGPYIALDGVKGVWTASRFRLVERPSKPLFIDYWKQDEQGEWRHPSGAWVGLPGSDGYPWARPGQDAVPYRLWMTSVEDAKREALRKFPEGVCVACHDGFGVHHPACAAPFNRQ